MGTTKPESNENPTTAYEKRDDFSFFQSRTRSLWGGYFFSLQLQSTHTPKKTPKKKIKGGGALY